MSNVSMMLILLDGINKFIVLMCYNTNNTSGIHKSIILLVCHNTKSANHNLIILRICNTANTTSGINT